MSQPSFNGVYGASVDDWMHFDIVLGLTEDLLPVVSNPQAEISESSTLKAIGKTPSSYNRRGKATGIAKWTELVTTPAQITNWSKTPDLGICVQTRRVTALDIDIDDKDTVAQIETFVTDKLGVHLPKRYRPNSGKALLAFRLPEGTVLGKRILRTSQGAVELLATGQQFIAVGTHPSGCRYEWDGGLPPDFPTISIEQLEDLWSELTVGFGSGEATVVAPSSKAEKLSQAHSNDAVVAHLFEVGRVFGTHTDGRVFIRCPFEDDHSDGPQDVNDTSTAYWPAHTGGYVHGHFKCLHAHCEHRTDADFKAAIGYVESHSDDFDILLEEACPQGSDLAVPTADTSDPTSDFDVVPTTDEHEAVAAQSEKKKSKFVFEHITEFSAGEPIGWLVKHVLPLQGVGVLYGESGSGKSFVALDMMMSIALGAHDWQGHKIKKEGAKVAYIVAEGASGFKKRIQAYAESKGADLAKAKFMVLNGTPNLLDKAQAVDLARGILAAGGAKVIVIDTLAQTTPGGNENSSEDMGFALNMVREIQRITGSLVLLIHHSGKDKLKGARGWSGLRAACDVELEVSRVEHTDNVRELSITKQKDGEDGGRWPFMLDIVQVGVDDDLDPITSCVVSYDIPEEALTPKVTEMFTAKQGNLKQLYEIFLELRQDQTAGIESEAILEEFVRRRASKEPNKRIHNFRSTAKRALDSLLDKGYLVEENGCLELGGQL